MIVLNLQIWREVINQNRYFILLTQIQLNGRGLVDVLVNGEAVIFDELSLLEFNGVSVLQYVNTSKFSAIFNSGISVTVEGQQELLGLVTLVPTIFKGRSVFCRFCFTFFFYYFALSGETKNS